MGHTIGFWQTVALVGTMEVVEKGREGFQTEEDSVYKKRM